ncbi:STR-94 protein [Aphelenchoides avenae]|nr:STR-94 protein [Aphelenchus avenae]
MLSVAKLHHYADACVSSLSLIFNFLLLYMLMKRTTVEMRQYRKVLLMTCISDIALSSIVFIAQPAVLPHEDVVMMVTNGWFANRTLVFDHVVLATFCAMLHTNIVLIVVQFVYRYRMLCFEKSKEAGNVGLFVAAGIWCALQAVDAYWCFVFGASDESRQVGLDAEPRTKVHHSMYMVSTIGGYTVIVTCQYKIMKYLRERRHLMSSATRRMNDELNRALVALAVAPLLSSSGPTALIVALEIFRVSPGYILGFATLGASLITMINPLTTIYFVRPFRRSLLRMLHVKQPESVVKPHTPAAPGDVEFSKTSRT